MKSYWYEIFPFFYIAIGSIAGTFTDIWIVKQFALLLVSAGLLIFYLRLSYRQQIIEDTITVLSNLKKETGEYLIEINKDGFHRNVK